MNYHKIYEQKYLFYNKLLKRIHTFFLMLYLIKIAFMTIEKAVKESFMLFCAHILQLPTYQKTKNIVMLFTIVSVIQVTKFKYYIFN